MRLNLISVVIPVRNGEATIHDCLNSIYNQTIADQLEVIILDSASTDDTLAICKQFPVQIHHIQPKEFNHGLTRNFGASLAKGDMIYYTVQDARIAESDMLARMVRYFEDTTVAGVVGMQAVPSEKDKNPATWFKRFSEPKMEVKYFPEGSFYKLNLKDQFINSAWDNVNAMYRKTSLKLVPFKKTNFSEDWLWANDALKNGYKLIRDASCVTYHYHHRSFKYTFKADFIVNYYFFRYFNVKPAMPNAFSQLLRSWYRVFKKRNSLTVNELLYWCSHNLSSITAHTLSHTLFILICALDSNMVLDRAYQFFCKQIPQGKQKAK
ncbi:glycosyltransferase family 2 protein [Pontibacter sp. Tf4]|uniref:glycosyltransferase family 2 protein n=1 Tax=Pontibacter sp. Tf4 TaxID=2761620 RepID=UPI0016238F75|nr:glycosyltransferase family 2 protein [Pontibacter sp. Tf4]MBB6610334.1 glycosyltransferase family 2 protein [Pontibacter sp. Tf4]